MKLSITFATLFAPAAVTAFTSCPATSHRAIHTSGLSMAETPFFSSDISKALDNEVSNRKTNAIEKAEALGGGDIYRGEASGSVHLRTAYL